MMKYIGVPVDVLHLLHNNPLQAGQARGAVGRRNGGLGSTKIWYCSYFYKKCLIINLIILEFAKKYLVL